MRMGSYYRANLLRFLGLARSEGRVLDIGGYDGFVLSRLSAGRKVSVDIQPSPANEGIDYCQGDGLNLPFSDAAFDAVYAMDVLEHVDDEQTFLCEIVRVLKPGGRLILTTPQDDIRIYPSVLTPWANRRWGHYRVPGYSEAAVKSWLSSAGLRSIEIRRLSASWFLKLFLPYSLVWRVNQGLGRMLMENAARLDAKGRGRRGYLLAEVTK